MQHRLAEPAASRLAGWHCARHQFGTSPFDEGLASKRGTRPAPGGAVMSMDRRTAAGVVDPLTIFLTAEVASTFAGVDAVTNHLTD